MDIRHHRLDFVDVDLYLARRPKHWRKLRKKFTRIPKEVPTSLGTTHMTYGAGEAAVIFYIDERKCITPSLRVDLAAHEASHAANFILNYMGEEKRTHEVEPYMVGWMAGWLWEGVNQ